MIVERYWKELQAILAKVHTERIEALDKNLQHQDAGAPGVRPAPAGAARAG